MTQYLGNPWDWAIIILLIILAIATGVKDGDKTVVPKPIIIRSYGLMVIILIVLNFPSVVRLFTGG